MSVSKLAPKMILTLLLISMLDQSIALAFDIQPAKLATDIINYGDLAAEIRQRGSPGIIPSPEVLKYYRELGQDPPRVSGWPAKSSQPSVIGTRTVLVIMIDFPDQSGVQNQAYYRNFLFGGTQGTLSHYYQEVSYGLLKLKGVMAGTGWYRSSNRMDWWGKDADWTDNANADLFDLVREAVLLADKDVNFKAYDLNNNAVIDPDELSICIIHAGDAQEQWIDRPDLIYSGQWWIYGSGYYSPRPPFNPVQDTFVDGCRISRRSYPVPDNVGAYFLQAESSPLGVFAHEFAHVLGLPDLYNPSTGRSVVDYWSLMDIGCWLGGDGNNGTTPAHPDPWSKVQMGWLSPTVVGQYLATTVDQTESTSGNRLYRLNIRGTQQYFLIENREKTGYDSALPEYGVLIWHIDESIISLLISNNAINSGSISGIAVEQPGGSRSSAAYSSNDGQTAFDSGTTPNSTDANDGSITSISVWGIAVEGASMDVRFFSPAYTDKLEYDLGQTVTLGFRNTGSTTITLPNPAPWTIRDASGGFVYGLTTIQVPVDVPPRTNIEWQWNQVDNSGQQAQPGTYVFRIGTSAGSFTAWFRIRAGYAYTDKLEYDLGQTVTLGFRNTGSTTITLPNPANYDIRDASGGLAYAPSTTIQVLVDVPAGTTTTWQWNQRDNSGQQVPPGTYIFQVGTSAGSFTATFSIKPAPTGGYAYTDKSQYDLGKTVTLGFRNTGSTTITLPNTAPWDIRNASGSLVYSPIALQVLVDVPAGTTTTWQWNQRDNSGQQVPPGTYIFQVGTSAGSFTATFSIKPAPKERRQLTTDPSTQDRPSLIVAEAVPVLGSGGTGSDVSDSSFFLGYFLAYQSWETGEPNNGDIFVEKYDRNWNPVKKVQATNLASYQDSPSLALVFDGSSYYLKLAYVSTETGNYDIFVQTFDLDLNFIAKKQVTSSPYDQDFPSIIFDGKKSIYIAYQSWETGVNYGGDIFIDKFNLNLEFPPLTRVRVSNESSYQDCPTLFYNSETGIIYTAYASNETGNPDLFLKQYDSNLNYLGKKFQLANELTAQFRPSLTPLFSTYPSIRGFQLTYDSWETGIPNNQDIFVKEFDLDCNELRKTQITNDQFYSATPSTTWALIVLDGPSYSSYITYVSNENGDWDIWLQQFVQVTLPILSLVEPQIDGLNVTVNGTVSPGSPGTSITRIRWNWGDGYQEDRGFPASHTYTNYGDYTITVTAYQSDSQTSTVAKQIYRLAITVSPSGAGSTNPSAGNYLYNAGQSVTVSETPNSGYSFDHWELDGGNVGSPTSYTVSIYRGHSLKAVFSGKPDLIVSDISWTPSNPAEGDNVTFTVHIKNQGTADAGNFKTAYYINGTKLGEWSITSLSTGQTTTETFSRTAVLGTYTVKAFADSNYNIDEGSNEGNNQREETLTVLGKPDVIISDISWTPASPVEGSNVIFTVYVRNQGTASAVSFDVACYIDGAKLGQFAVTDLSIGQTTSKNFSWTAIYGSHIVKAYADSNYNITEKDENNNQREESFAVSGLPDLIVLDINWSPVSFIGGETVTFTVTIKNNGTINAGSFSVVYYIDGAKLGEWSISGLNAGQNTTKTFTWSAVQGSHKVEVFADSNYNVEEKDETNNERDEIVGNQPPVASFCCRNKYDYMNNSIIFMCESTCFNASGSYDQDESIISYIWNFGDGNITSMTSAIVYHNYTMAGIYSVALNVTDNQGSWNAVTANVEVRLLGDITNDGTVNIVDISTVAIAFGSKRGGPRWDEKADLDNSGEANIIDISIIATNFGKKL